MPKPKLQAAAEGLPTAQTARDLIFDAEEDLLKVKDLALILNNGLTGTGDMKADLRNSLAWPAPIRWPGSNLMHGGLAGDV